MRTDKYMMAKAWMKQDQAPQSEALETWNTLEAEFNEERKAMLMASAESDKLKEELNKDLGPGTIKYGSEIPQPSQRPDVIEIDAINAFMKRNPAAEGGRMEFGRGKKVLDKTEKKNVLNWGKNKSKALGETWSDKKTLKEYNNSSRFSRSKIRLGIITGEGIPGFKKKGDFKPLTKEQQIRFGNDNAKMTETEAMLYATDDLAAEMAQIQKTYLDQTRFLKPYNPQPGPTLVDKTYASIIEEGTQGMTLDQNNIMSSDNLLGATAQDFNVAKGTGFDNTATNLQEGFNEDGDYIVSFDQIAKYEGEPALTTTYNLSTEAGAKDFLLARFENEQGRRASNAKDTKESKEDAIRLAPIYAKSFRDYNKALKRQQAERIKFEEEQEKINQITMSLDPDFESRPGYSRKQFKPSRPEIFEGITIEE